MKPSSFFHHCPRCGAKQINAPEGLVFVCAECGFTLHFSSAIGTATFIERDDGCVLFIRRAKEPAKGKLAPPGGFVDIGETAEQGMRREIREEVGLEVADVRYLCSHMNRYVYKDVAYPVLDLFFVARALTPENARALDDVAGLIWLQPDAVAMEEIAFPSMRAALALWLEQRRA